MKGIPILGSKLKTPQLPPVVAGAKRLQRLCREMSERNSIIITAPAGYGKTTLMVSFLQKCKAKGDRICWYRLGKEDRDLAVFYTHLVETLFPAGEGPWEELRDYLSNCGDIYSQHQYLNALICQELWAFYNLCPGVKTVIAFDDFQQIIDSSEIYMAIQFFIDNLPENCTVIVSSRCETGLLTGKRRLEKNCLEITRESLCFSENETTTLLKERTLINLGQTMMNKIMLHTEGWPAGIILVCQMFSASSTGEVDSILDRSGQNELFFHYMATEVLKTVDERLLRFLVKTAILTEFTAAEAADILGADNALQILEECYEKGLFMQKISAAVTTFRIHSLFRDALLQVRPRYMSAEEVKNYHLKAAAYYIEHQIFERAIEHFIACGNIDLAVELIAKESVRLLAFEAVEQLRLWFKLLPEEVVSGNGYLLYIKSLITYQNGIESALLMLERAFALFQQANDGAMLFFTLIAMAHLKVQRNDVRGLKKIHVQVAMLSETVARQPFKDMSAVFDFTIAIWEEKFSRGASLFRLVQQLSVSDEWQWMVLIYSSQMYYLLGEVNIAEREIREALELDITKRSELLRGYTQLVYSMILQIKDDQISNPWIMDELMAIGEKHDYKFLLGYGKKLGALACYRRHDLDQALEMLETSTSLFEELGNTSMTAANQLYRELWLCHRRNPEEVPAEASKALKVLTAGPSGHCLHEIGLSIFGVIAREAGEYELAEKNLTASLKKSKAKGTKQIIAGVCLHMAKLCYDTGNQAMAEGYLMQAFNLAEDGKYVMFWDMHFPTLVEMALRCVKSRIYPDYALTLIDRYYGSEAAEFLRRTALNSYDPKKSADAFLSRYGTREDLPAPIIRVNLFGRFSISINDIVVSKAEWKTKKITGVLKYLLVHRGRAISKDRLMDVFWPGSDKKLASMSLRAAQYELKKVLRKYGVSVEAGTSFLNEKRDTLEVRTGKMLVVDIDLFLSYFNELKKLSPTISDPDQKATILERMVALYQGDLLEDELYEDWAFAEREELRSIYFGAVMELANIYIMGGDNGKAEKLLLRILDMDQYNEEACLCLLRLYMTTNQKGRAVKLYSKFADRFEKELNIRPDDKLSAVIHEQV